MLHSRLASSVLRSASRRLSSSSSVANRVPAGKVFAELGDPLVTQLGSRRQTLLALGMVSAGTAALFAVCNSALCDSSPKEDEEDAIITAPPVVATTLATSGAALPVHGAPGTNQERTFLAVKPDGVQRALVGDIIARFEKRGYKLVGLKMVWPTLKMAQDHYSDLATKPFYPSLCTFFSSGPIVCMCWEGKDIIRQGRRMLGETQPLASLPGSIRGDYSIDLGRNICHGSDAPDAAKKELGMWFPEGVNDWAKTVDGWVYEG